MLGIGAVIGTGIFVLTGQAAAANAGPASVISMVLAGLTSVLAALCYSEFAASVPVSGSAYAYAYATLGEFVAWIVGWDLVLEYALGAATVAVGWSGNLVTLLIVIGAGAFFIDTANWYPFVPENTGTFGEYGYSGILRGAAVIFFAYLGFDAVSTSAQEAVNPQRDMPRGILGSLAICTVLYVLLSGVMVGLVPYKTMLNEPAPLAVAIAAAAERAAGTAWAAPLDALVSLGLMMSLPWATWQRLIAWMALGVAVYALYGYRRSKLRERES